MVRVGRMRRVPFRSRTRSLRKLVGVWRRQEARREDVRYEADGTFSFGGAGAGEVGFGEDGRRSGGGVCGREKVE